MKKTGLLLLTVLFIFGATAQEKNALTTKIEINAPKIPIDPSVKIGKLSNGLTYYIKNNGKPADKVELRLVVNAGSYFRRQRSIRVSSLYGAYEL